MDRKTIAIIVSWAAAGNTNTVVRLTAKGLQEELGVNVYVFNKTGGSGVVIHDTVKPIIRLALIYGGLSRHR